MTGPPPNAPLIVVALPGDPATGRIDPRALERVRADAMRTVARAQHRIHSGGRWIMRWWPPNAEADSGVEVCRMTPPAHLSGDALESWLFMVGGACAVTRLGLPLETVCSGHLQAIQAPAPGPAPDTESPDGAPSYAPPGGGQWQ